jgi:DNA repair exonuclease SbcCD ATPase subunit
VTKTVVQGICIHHCCTMPPPGCEHDICRLPAYSRGCAPRVRDILCRSVRKDRTRSVQNDRTPIPRRRSHKYSHRSRSRQRNHKNLKEENKDLITKLGKEEEAVSKYKRRIDELEKNNNDLEQRNSELEKNIDDLKCEKHVLCQKVDQYRISCANLTKEYEDKLAVLQKRLSAEIVCKQQLRDSIMKCVPFLFVFDYSFFCFS